VAETVASKKLIVYSQSMLVNQTGTKLYVKGDNQTEVGAHTSAFFHSGTPKVSVSLDNKSNNYWVNGSRLVETL